jgi:hypothetical protein
MQTHFIVRISTAPVKGKARRFASRYIRLAVLEVPVGVTSVPAIDVRGRNVVRIVHTWGFRRALHLGKTSRSVGQMAIANAERMVARLNRRAMRRALASFDPCV